MAELPYHLRTLPPEALDILRYYSTLSTNVAYTNSIMDGADLSDRGFGKAIRRLVTKNYLVMDSDQRYRLTEQGNQAVAEIKKAGGGPTRAPRRIPRMVQAQRRLVMTLPQPLVAGELMEANIGFLDAEDDQVLPEPMTLLLRLGAINGQPWPAQEASFTLQNRRAYEKFDIMAGEYELMRLRVQVYQFDEDSGDVQPVGGMYVDVPVTTDATRSTLTAYGVDLQFTQIVT
jgi:predicted transcriptional regulator